MSTGVAAPPFRVPTDRPWAIWAGLAALVAAVVVVRLTGPSDLLDNDQLGPAAYAVDVVENGSWVVQRDTSGDIASKPPMTTWMIALGAHAMGSHVSRLALAIPSIIGLLGMAAITAHLGSRYIGRAAGWWGAVALIVSPMGFKQAILVRTDSMYGFCAALCGWALWEAVRRGGRTWVWFWLAAALATLTKGPVAPLITAAGLAAWVWPKDASNQPEPRSRAGSTLAWNIVGILVLAVCAGGWVYLAWRSAGSAFIDKLFGRELVGHMVTSVRGKPPLVEFYLPVLYYLGRFAPGSVLTMAALWSVIARPATDPTTRRFERFVWWWFVGGLVVFSIAPHQRPDLMTPIWVAGSILAGRAVADLVRALRPMSRWAIGSAWIALGLIGGVLEHHTHASRKPEVRAEADIRALAADLVTRFDGPPPMVHVSDNSSMQFYLHRRVDRTPEDAAMALAAGAEPCAIAVSAKSGFCEAAAARGIELRELARTDHSNRFGVVILGNAAAWADSRWPEPDRLSRSLR